jgi:hypothetical protein
MQQLLLPRKSALSAVAQRPTRYRRGAHLHHRVGASGHALSRMRSVPTYVQATLHHRRLRQLARQRQRHDQHECRLRMWSRRAASRPTDGRRLSASGRQILRLQPSPLGRAEQSSMDDPRTAQRRIAATRVDMVERSFRVESVAERSLCGVAARIRSRIGGGRRSPKGSIAARSGDPAPSPTLRGRADCTLRDRPFA